MKYQPQQHPKPTLPSPGDIVRIHKKTRGKFAGKKAMPGEKEYLILNTWTSSYGSIKLSIIDDKGEEYFTTITCSELITREGGDRYKWVNAKYAWMEKTYVPAFVIPQAGYNGKKAYSVTNKSVLVKNLTPTNGNINIGFWISERHCHPSDWKKLRETPLKQVASVRIPEWMARKNNLLPTPKPF